MFENIGFLAFHELSVILGEFERSPLEVHVTWGAGKHKTKINVYDMPIDIHEDIIVMPILDIE